MPGQNTFTKEQRNLLKRINTDPNYINPVRNNEEAKYKTGFERLINRALSDKCTAQDLLNLGVVAANMKKYHSQKKVTQLGVDFYDSICRFCNDLTGLEKDETNFQYFDSATFFDEEPGYKKKSNMGLNPQGYVILTDEQKLKLLGFREKIINTKDYNELFGDAAFMKQAYETLKNGAGNTARTRIQKADYESLLVDRELQAASNGSIYAMQHPEVGKLARIQAPAQQPGRKKEPTSMYDRFMAGTERIEELKEAFNSMEDHTKISFFNSKEFKTMERAYKAYVDAYENLAAGKTIEGFPKDLQNMMPSQDDYARLNQLQENMKNVAKAYTSAKREQKNGGINSHSTKQGKDRLAIADVLSDFNPYEDPFNDEYSPKVIAGDELNAGKDNAKVKNVKLSDIDETASRGRAMLNKHIRKLEKKEEMNNQPKTKEQMKT